MSINEYHFHIFCWKEKEGEEKIEGEKKMKKINKKYTWSVGYFNFFHYLNTRLLDG